MKALALNDLDQPIYSRVDIAAAATSQIQFFTTGSGNRQYTNLTTPRRLPGTNHFRCTGIRLYLHSFATNGATPATLVDVAGYQLGHLQINLDGANSQFDALGLLCPGGAGIGGIAAEGAAATQLGLANGSVLYSQFRRFRIPILIKAMQDFEVNLNFLAAWTPSAILIGVCALEGFYTRRAQ